MTVTDAPTTEATLGDTLLVQESFTKGGTLTDPDSVSLVLTDPQGGVHSYNYAGSTITRISTGVYGKQYAFTLLGAWTVKWDGTGAAPGVGRSIIVVTDVTPSQAVRTELSLLIEYVRGQIADPAGSDQVFSDLEVQRALDYRKRIVKNMELAPLPEYAVGAGLSPLAFLTYAADRSFWDLNAAVLDRYYNVLTPSDIDYLEGVWYFNPSQLPPVFLTGVSYDLYRSCGDLCMAWASKLTREFDFGVGRTRYARSQQYVNLLAQAQMFYARALPKVGLQVRQDQIPSHESFSGWDWGGW